MYIKSYRILSIRNKRALTVGSVSTVSVVPAPLIQRGVKNMMYRLIPDRLLAFGRLGQSKQFHRFLRSGTSFESWIEKPSGIGVDADI